MFLSAKCIDCAVPKCSDLDKCLNSKTCTAVLECAVIECPGKTGVALQSCVQAACGAMMQSDTFTAYQAMNCAQKNCQNQCPELFVQ